MTAHPSPSKLYYCRQYSLFSVAKKNRANFSAIFFLFLLTRRGLEKLIYLHCVVLVLNKLSVTNRNNKIQHYDTKFDLISAILHTLNNNNYISKSYTNVDRLHSA